MNKIIQNEATAHIRYLLINKAINKCRGLRDHFGITDAAGLLNYKYGIFIRPRLSGLKKNYYPQPLSIILCRSGTMHTCITSCQQHIIRPVIRCLWTSLHRTIYSFYFNISYLTVAWGSAVASTFGRGLSRSNYRRYEIPTKTGVRCRAVELH